MMWKLSVVVVLFVICSWNMEVDAYGEPLSPGVPNYIDRAIHTLTNAARIDPTGYKKLYMAGYANNIDSILLSGTYPATNPLYLEPNLTLSATQHSVEMAQKNYFSHSSYDGTDVFTRIGKYYSCAGAGLAENIAAGGGSPLGYVNMWLCDGNNGACAPDKNGDGHRADIMGGYTSIGVGWGYQSGSDFGDYSTQDFGKACAQQNSIVHSGSHILKDLCTTKFLATYWDPAGNPRGALAVVNGQSWFMSRDIGTANKGVYKFEQTKSTVCRPYYFQFVNSAGTTVRYPTTGCLVTNEGNNCPDFDASCTTVTVPTTPAPVYVYQNGAMAGKWGTYGNGGINFNYKASYGGVSPVLNFNLINQNGDDWMSFWSNPAQPLGNLKYLLFSAAASAPVSGNMFFNGGLTKNVDLTTAWQNYTIALSDISAPSSGLTDLDFSSGPSSNTQYYFKDIRFQTAPDCPCVFC